MLGASPLSQGQQTPYRGGATSKRVGFSNEAIQRDSVKNSPEAVMSKKIESILKFIEKSVFKNLNSPEIALRKLSEAKSKLKAEFTEDSEVYKKIMAKILVQEAKIHSKDIKTCEALLAEAEKFDSTDDRSSIFSLTAAELYKTR